MNGLPKISVPVRSSASVKARCAYLVEQANLLSASGNSIWEELPCFLALELAVELAKIHRTALSVLAWFSDDQAHRPNFYAFYDQLETYLYEAERFIETLEKTSC